MLENFSYCPTLHTRVAEMKALSQLPASTKDRIFPLLVARPWPNARHLIQTWDKIGDALGVRRFALDLDETKRNSGSGKPAADEFDALFESRNGFSNYYQAVTEIAEAIPVLRLIGGSAIEFDAQAKQIEKLDRGIIVRVAHGRVTNPMSLVNQVLDRFTDISLFIDTGWSRDIISREGWASDIVGRVSRDYPEIEIVVSGSSFPDSFAKQGERSSVPVGERILYNNLRRQHNAATLIYGDWGSTRSPSAPIPMRNIPRIDLPTTSQWISFRRDNELDDEENYADIARRVIADPEWPSNLSIWGTYTIGWTAKGEPGAIRSPTTAAAARINIHLHRQALYGSDDITVDGDEPYTDD